MSRNKAPPAQASMFDTFEKADFERATAHLPSTIVEAIPVYRDIIGRFHTAILAGDSELAGSIENEADTLAIRLNGGEHCGIKGGEGSVCDQLERATAAADGTIPLWGQTGNFITEIHGCRVRIDFDGLYGICLPYFSAHVVDVDRKFISETGYRSFMGHGLNGRGSVDEYVRTVIEHHIAGELKGKLLAIKPECRERLQREGEPGLNVR